MSRSLKKGPYVNKKLMKKISRMKAGDKNPIKIWDRSSVITPEMIGYVFAVYNGKDFIKVEAREEMVGHRLGEFSPTRKFIRHGGKMQRELETKSKTEQKEGPTIAKVKA